MHKTILITRPEARSESLQVKLSQKGYKVIHVPCLRMQPTGKKIENLQDYQIVIFVSVNAVEGFFSAQPPSFKANSIVMAIGEKTASRLQEFGVKEVVYPVSEFSQNSENFMQLPELKNIKNTKILLVRGDYSREYLSTALIAAGASLDELEVYKSLCPDNLTQMLDANLISLSQQEFADLLILVTSNSILENMTSHLKKDYLHKILECKLMVVSDRIAVRAKELGYKNIFVTNTMNEDSIIAMMKQ